MGWVKTHRNKNLLSTFFFTLLKVEGFDGMRFSHSQLVPETKILLRLLRIN